MLGATVAIVASFTSAGAAAPGYVRDPADTLGPLDLAAASVQQRTKGRGRKKRRFIVLRLRTYEHWDPREVGRGGGTVSNFLSFEFDRKRRRPGQRCLDIDIEPAGVLEGRLKRSCIPIPLPRFEAGPKVRVRRRGPRRVEVVVPLRLFGGVASYRWRAASSFEAPGHQACPPPPYPPPERRYGTCTDLTRWGKVRR